MHTTATWETRRPQVADLLRTGNLELLPDLQVRVDGQRLALTRREFEVLSALVRREGEVVGKDRLYEQVWWHPMRPRERSVDVYVGRLRQKLAEAAPGWTYIHTHRGFGYRFDPEPSLP